jgi:hypothetical protein
MAEEQFERRTAFNAGEISAWLDPRIDQDKYHLGCRQMRNLRPTVYGGAFKRPGTEYLGAARVNTGRVRLLAFQYEVGTTYVLELTDLRMRVWTTGPTPAVVADPDAPGTALTITTPWGEGELNALQVCQLNDLLFVTHPDHQPRVVARYAGNDWRVVRYNPDWPALLEINDRNVTLQCTAANATPAAWSIATTYDAGDEVIHEGEDYACRLDDCRKIEPGDHKNWKRWWRVKDGTGTLGIGRRVTVSASKNVFQTGHVGSKWVLIWRRDELKKVLHLNGGSVGKTTGSIYCLGEWSASLLADNSGSGDWDVEVSIQRSENNKTWQSYKTITGSKSEVQSILTGNEEEPCFLRIKLTARSGSIPAQYKGELEVGNPDQHGIIRIKSVTNATTATAILEFPVPNSDTTKYWHEPAWSDARGFPRAITLHEGRLWFGATKHQPTTFWATAVDRFETFRIGVASHLGLEFQIMSDEANAIQWLVSHDGLMIGTKGAEWFYGQRLGEDLPKLRKNTSYGSAAVQARVVNETLVFFQRSQRKLRELAWDGDRFACQDLTLLAEHFGDAKFLQVAVQRNPETVVWIITNQGDLIGMTYERGQNVTGWFRYETGGTYGTGGTTGNFESVALVEGAGEEDEIWVAVKRVINGATVRFIERFQPDLIRNIKENDQAELVYSDAAVVRSGSPTTTMTGLAHLNGARVSILADGAPHPSQVVADGQITLQWSAAKIIAGLPFHAYLEPTYLESSDPGSITKAFRKRMTRATIEFWKSLGCEVSGDNGQTWQTIEFRNVADLMDQAPPLFSGIKEEAVTGGSERQVSPILRSTQPLPMNVLSLTMRYVMGTA